MTTFENRKKTNEERSSLTGRSPSVQKFAVWVGAEESHSDFRHHLQTQDLVVFDHP